MPRVKRGKTHVKKRKKLLSQAKGFKWGRKNTIRLAKDAVIRAGAHTYKGMKLKKIVTRSLWQIQINTAVRKSDINYSKFIHLLTKNKVHLTPKVLAKLANKVPTAFDKIVESVKK